MTSNEKKRPYSKPEITQVRLLPEEAVLGGCKTPGGGGVGEFVANCQLQSPSCISNSS